MPDGGVDGDGGVGVGVGDEGVPRVKLTDVLAELNVLEDGLNVYPDWLGVARYVVPEANPVRVQRPLLSVVTDPGMVPVPDVRLNVIDTPATPEPLLVVTRPDTV